MNNKKQDIYQNYFWLTCFIHPVHLQDLEVRDGGMLLNMILSLQTVILLSIHIQMHSMIWVWAKTWKKKKLNTHLLNCYDQWNQCYLYYKKKNTNIKWPCLFFRWTWYLPHIYQACTPSRQVADYMLQLLLHQEVWHTYVQVSSIKGWKEN